LVIAIIACVIIGVGARPDWADSMMNQQIENVKRWLPTACAENGYDLSALAGVDYPAQDPSYDYILNICGVSSEANCGARNGSFCQYSFGSPPVFKHVLAEWDLTGNWSALDPNNPAKGVQVQFANGDPCFQSSNRQVLFTFPCAQTNSTTYQVVTVMPCVYVVQFPTSASCPAGCKNTVDGFSFDLSPLAAPSGLSLLTHYYEYLWNPCGVVMSDSRCASGNGTVCQYQIGGSQMFQLASWTQPPAPTWTLLDPHNGDAGVILTYANGQSCGDQPRVVTEKFICSSSSSNYTVVETLPCAYTITMSTPAACPV